MALLRAPPISAMLVISVHPAANNHRDHTGVFLGHFSQVVKIVFVKRRFATTLGLVAIGGLIIALAFTLAFLVIFVATNTGA